jgi:hypothetical protein
VFKKLLLFLTITITMLLLTSTTLSQHISFTNIEPTDGYLDYTHVFSSFYSYRQTDFIYMFLESPSGYTFNARELTLEIYLWDKINREYYSVFTKTYDIKSGWNYFYVPLNFYRIYNYEFRYYKVKVFLDYDYEAYAEAPFTFEFK